MAQDEMCWCKEKATCNTHTGLSLNQDIIKQHWWQREISRHQFIAVVGKVCALILKQLPSWFWYLTAGRNFWNNHSLKYLKNSKEMSRGDRNTWLEGWECGREKNCGRKLKELWVTLNDNSVGFRYVGCHNPFFYKTHFTLCWLWWLHPVHSED